MNTLWFVLVLIPGFFAEVSLQLTPSRGAVLDGVANEVDVMVQITTPLSPAGAKPRSPFDLCVVLDASGSMAEYNKMREAKAAIQNIISQLGPEDTLSLVTFNSRSTIQFEAEPASRQARMREIVAEIYPAGGTYMHAGLESARGILRKHATPLRPQRVFVLSDGLTTDREYALEQVEEMGNEGITLHSFGVGDDFDEALMLGVAEKGKGEYFFLDQDSDFTRIITVAFDGLTSLLGSKAVLSVKGVDGTIVTQAWGYPNKVLMDGIQIGDLRYNSTSRLFFRLSVPGNLAGSSLDVSPLLQGSLPVQKQQVFTCTLAYRPVETEAMTNIQAFLSLSVVESKEDVQAARNFHVEDLVKLQEASIQSEQILQALHAGDMELAEKTVNDQIESYGQTQSSAFCLKGTACYEEADIRIRRGTEMKRKLKNEATTQAARVKQASYDMYNSRSSQSHRNEL